MVRAAPRPACRTCAAPGVRVRGALVYAARSLVHNERLNYAELLHAALRHQGSMPGALGALRDRGASPAEAAAAVSSVTGSSAVDARALVRDSGVWSGPRGAGAGAGSMRARLEPVGRHGRSGHGASTVLPYLVQPYVRPGRGGPDSRA